jgi:hypothetical protein
MAIRVLDDPVEPPIAVNPSKLVMELGSKSTAMNPSSAGPGANTWRTGPYGGGRSVSIPPGIGIGFPVAAVAGPVETTTPSATTRLANALHPRFIATSSVGIAIRSPRIASGFPGIQGRCARSNRHSS